jgi:hypothetical protein
MAVCAACVAAAGCLSACGDASSGDPVAQVGTATISKAMLNSWMSSITGGDFYEAALITPPTHLVSDPPNYGLCVRRLKAMAPSFGAAALMTKCRDLYLGIKEQTLRYLLSALQRVGEDGELGVKVSEGEVRRRFAYVKAREFTSEAEYRRYLARRDWGSSVELFLVKADLLGSKLRQKLKERFGSDEAAEAKYLEAEAAKWKAKTSCRPGYVIELCRQYKHPASEPALQSPAVVAELIKAAIPAPKKTVSPNSDMACKNKKNGKGLSCHYID